MSGRWLAMFIQMAVMAVSAQEADSLAIKEVVVEGARVVNKADGRVIYVADEQKKSSATVFGVLAKVGLDGVRVDEVMRTITPLDDKGRVEVRVNGVPAEMDDLLRVSPSDLLRVEYTDSPGVRYGRDVGRVINLIVRVPTAGYAAGAHLTDAVTAVVGSNSVYASANRGNSELGVDYGMAYRSFDEVRQEETTRYLMPDNSVMTVRRSGLDGRSASVSHNVGLAYSLRLDSVMAMQLRLKAAFSRSPHNDSRNRIDGMGGIVESMTASSSRSAKPEANLFVEARLGETSRITVNAVASLDDSRQWHSYDEGTPYTYGKHGRGLRFDGEAMLESALKPFTMTLGLLCSQLYDEAEFDGDVAANDCSRVSDIYAFGQLKGRLWHIGYACGVGASIYYFRRNASSHRFVLFRPRLTLQFPLARRLKLRYDFEQSEYMSKVANTGSAFIRINNMEAEVGNPDLRPYRRIEHSLRLSYDAARLSASLNAVSRQNKDCNMPQYTRQTDMDGKPLFVATQRNGGDCNMFYVSGNVTADIVPHRLVCSANGGVYRFVNIGDGYRHYYTAFNGGLALAAYFGKLTLTANADNGWNFMEGETRGHQGGALYLTAAYKIGDFTIAAYWQHPFRSRVTSVRTDLLNALMSKESTVTNGNLGNMLSISVSWTFEKGRKYTSIR